jgi:hypothetical protein
MFRLKMQEDVVIWTVSQPFQTRSLMFLLKIQYDALLVLGDGFSVKQVKEIQVYDFRRDL